MDSVNQRRAMYLRSRAAAREGSLQTQRIHNIQDQEPDSAPNPAPASAPAIEGFSNKKKGKNEDAKAAMESGKKVFANIKNVLAYVNAPYSTIKYGFTKSGASIAAILSMNRAKSKDATIITDQLYAISSIVTAIWVAYNWFFIFVYKPHESVGPEIMRITPLDLGHFVPTTLFRYTVVPLYVLQAFLHEYIGPVFAWIARVIGNKIAFMIIFAIAIGMVRMNGDFVVREFFNAIQCKFSAMMGMWSALMIGYSLYITFHVPVNIPVIGPYINPVVDLVNGYYIMSSPFSLIISAIRFFIRLGFAMAIGFVSSAMVFGYILFLSLFSIFAYKNPRFSISETIKIMLSFVSSDITERPCKMTLFEKIKYSATLEYYFNNPSLEEENSIRYKAASILFTICEYIYEVVFYIAFIGAFSNSTSIFWRTISTRGLKLVLIVIMLLITTLLYLSMFVQLYTKYTTNPPVLRKLKAASIESIIPPSLNTKTPQNPTPEPPTEPTSEPTPEPTPEPKIEPKIEPTPEPTPEPKIESTPEPTPEPKTDNFATNKEKSATKSVVSLNPISTIKLPPIPTDLKNIQNNLLSSFTSKIKMG